MKRLIYRTAQLRGLALLGLLLLTLILLGGMIWRNVHRLEMVRSYMSYSHRIQQVSLNLQQVLLEQLSGVTQVINPDQLKQLDGEVKDLTTSSYYSAEETPEQLRRLHHLLSGLIKGQNQTQTSMLFPALHLMKDVLDAEIVQHEQILRDIIRDTRTELELAVGTLTAILLLGGWFLRRRIFSPLEDLTQLLSRLAEGDFTPISTHHLDPLLLPVFSSYNEMVLRLQKLEEEKRLHAQSLEAEIRTAAQALLEQQRSLARAERLAAVGELAASIAHELRNPLAGIRMSCSNLQKEISNPDQAQRLDLISSELKRLTRLLNNLLDQAKHTPQPATELHIASVVQELLALTRYQIPTHLKLESEIPETLNCRLPEGDFRQALLNLVLNAAQAMGETPGTVRVEAHQNDSTLYLTVSDEGPGFYQEMLDVSIRPFVSGDQRGTGLGLAMVQRFAQEVGGYVQLANKQPHGACVTLVLPYQREQHACHVTNYRGRNTFRH
ncbi:ATP-binding region ATPase domain protein [Nitrosococcus halophilus Nc 4]|uniref:histidine kinase n=1 Tax=Nitrosococcus halophilus (strain Nc4) TaxID=472759 RepID=D5BZH2_NITHN|nr:ATP-binding protein [Nitrosococcus halophilus]ADE16186.1 ATP-binding region ATPase domain protein [Nitrosococcus halophilus Nc 4]